VNAAYLPPGSTPQAPPGSRIAANGTGRGRVEAGVREGGMTLRLIPLTIVIPAKAGIQYAAAFRLNHRCLWNTGSSAFADDDSPAGHDAFCDRQNTAPRSRRVLRARFGLLVSPSPNRGRGDAGRPMRPIAACAEVVVESTRVSQVTPANTRHSPRNGLRLMARSPRRSGFLVTVTPEKPASRELDAGVEASGPHAFAVRIRRCSSRAPLRPPHPAPRP
jgi:hypothetical protein